MKKLVTIIVPIYNVEKYLNECIESILNQTYKNIEVVLVDDGSTDNSDEIIDEYTKKDSRIVAIHKKNEGVSSARNDGLKIARGEYICFADADDILMEDYVEYMYNMIERDKSDIALTKKMFSNFNNKQIKNDKQEIYSGEDTAIDIMLYNIPIGVYCKMFKKNFIEKENIRFLSDIYIGEGFNFNVKAFQKAQKVSIGYRKIYFYRRNNETSATTIFSYEKWKNGLKAIDVIKDNFSIKSKKTILAWHFAKWRTNVDVYSLLITSNTKQKYRELYDNCKKIGKKDAIYAFINPTALKEKMRAILMVFCPKLIPTLVIERRKKYSVDIKN